MRNMSTFAAIRRRHDVGEYDTNYDILQSKSTKFENDGRSKQTVVRDPPPATLGL